MEKFPARKFFKIFWKSPTVSAGVFLLDLGERGGSEVSLPLDYARGLRDSKFAMLTKSL